MSRYPVKFMKKVVGGRSHEVEICQRWFETEAPNKDAAIASAKERFCREEHVSHWSIHADRVLAAEAESPS